MNAFGEILPYRGALRVTLQCGERIILRMHAILFAVQFQMTLNFVYLNEKGKFNGQHISA